MISANQSFSDGAGTPYYVERRGYLPTKYMSENETEAAAAWASIQPGHGIVAIDAQWAAAHSLPPTHTWIEDSNKLIYGIEAYHAIHCIVSFLCFLSDLFLLFLTPTIPINIQSNDRGYREPSAHSTWLFYQKKPLLSPGIPITPGTVLILYANTSCVRPTILYFKATATPGSEWTNHDNAEIGTLCGTLRPNILLVTTPMRI